MSSGAPEARLDLHQLPEEPLAVLFLLHQDPVQLTGVEEDPLAVSAAIHAHALEVLLDQGVAALGASHEVQGLQTLELRGLLLRCALLLALLPRHARGLQELLLVLAEPLVLALAIFFQSTLLFEPSGQSSPTANTECQPLWTGVLIC